MKRFFRQYGRLTLALAAVLAFCAVLPLLFQQSRSIETGSWGLSFRTEGQPPAGNASKEALRRYDAVYLGDETQKKIYLTFDAGYENGCTEPILEALAKHNVKAAFFVVGNYIEQNPELVRRIDKHITTINTPQTHHCCGYICKICVMSSFESRIPNLNSTIDIAASNSDQIQISLTIKTAYQIQNLRLQRINKQSAAGNIIPPIPATTYSVAPIEFILHNILGSGNHCNSTTFAPSKKTTKPCPSSCKNG